MLVRTRRSSDLPDLVRLSTDVHRRDGYPPYLPDDDVLDFVTSDEALIAWVATDGMRVVGHVALHTGSSAGVLDLAAAALSRPPDQLGVVARLLVEPSLRRAGVGRQLLDQAMTECRRRGLVPILDVVDRFGPAIALYEAAGWRRLGTVEVRLPDGTDMREHVYAAPDRDDHL